eukprot:TRINITY_DN18253_c0_g1_i3.p1 TRINITY_DN18253_c0_g1~~TRINITY_DN18253_c0_g1_i3.p1  ORF type:complete len:179 (+),score=47.32 TRINITY_DN18253_c0_g1_i3:64-600(+)
MSIFLYFCLVRLFFVFFFFFFLMIRRPPRSTLSSSSAASDVYKRQVQWVVQDEPETFVNKIAAHLAAQGGDGRYTLRQNNPTVQPWNSNTSFVVQGQHISLKNLYVDTLHFAVTPSATGSGSTVLAFSHSQDFVLGNFAYGDDGQNYKNLAFFIKGMGVAYDETTVMGCPLPSEVVPE